MSGKCTNSEKQRETGFGLAVLAATVPSWEPGALQHYPEKFHLFGMEDGTPEFIEG